MFSAIIYAVPVQSGRGLLIVFCSSIHTGKEPKGMALSQDGLVKQNDINFEGGMYVTRWLRGRCDIWNKEGRVASCGTPWLGFPIFLDFFSWVCYCTCSITVMTSSCILSCCDFVHDSGSPPSSLSITIQVYSSSWSALLWESGFMGNMRKSMTI